MKEPMRLLLTACLALSVASCAAPILSEAFFYPGAFFAPGEAAGSGVTFAWDQDPGEVIGDVRLQNNQFFEDRLHEAVEWELSLRGMRRDESSPDLLLHHHLTIADHEVVVDVTDESGATRSDVYSYEEGSVVVHLADPESGEDLWLAWAQSNVEPALGGPENMRAWVYAIVAEMFEDWPVPERTGEQRR